MLEMFPEYWIEWFKLFYERTKNIKFEHYNNFRTTKAAVLVEPRDHPLLKYVIYNFMYLLAPQGWSLHVFCSNKNYQTINEIRKTMNLHIHLLPKDNLTEPEYNQLLTSENFYNEFDEKITHLLIFQTDTMLLKDNISDFLTFDLIGAAWSFSPHRGCNGGLSLRNRKKMLQMCKERICNENEDGFFSYTNQDMLNKIPTLEDKNNFSMETIWCDDPMGMHRAFGHQKHNEIKMKELLQRAWQRIFKNNDIIYDFPLTQELVRQEFTELGFISFNHKINNFKFYRPKCPIQYGRMQHVINFIVKYIEYHKLKKDFEYLYTLCDAWREHSEPSVNPTFIEATTKNIQPYKGRGSWGEPGRYIQSYDHKDEFLYFSNKILAFGRHKNDPYTILIPDNDFLKTNGYEELLKEISKEDTISWENKLNKIFWRGGMHGFGYKAYDNTEHPRCQRQMLCEKSNIFKEWLDVKPSNNTTKKEFLKYKYMIDVDGEVNAWSGLWWKLFSNSVVFKVDSHYEQWYYKELKEWIHYIPIKGDLSDLEEKYKWALEHDEECKQININSTEFIKQHTYEYVLSNIEL
jgi:hypothetical protein